MSGSGIDSSKVVRELKRLHDRAPELTDRLVGQWAENLVGEMKTEGVVPRDTGRLRDSHGWDRVKAGLWRLFANTTYAAAVHERHKTKGGWFRRVIAERALKTLEKTVERIRKELGT